MTKVNCVRPGIMSLIRVKDKGKIVKEVWFDMLHNNSGFFNIELSSVEPEPEPEPEPEAEWYNLMGFFIGEGMAGGFKVYDSDWNPLADMTEGQTITAGGGTVSWAGYGFTGGDTQNIEVHVMSTINGEQTELAGEKSLWIRVTENGNQVDISAEDATLTLSQDSLTLSWSYDTYAGTFTYNMSDINKPLLELGSVTHNGQACENAELMVKLIPATEEV